MRSLSSLSDRSGDYGLTDLLGGILRDHEKAVWFLSSHLYTKFNMARRKKLAPNG
ncbi:MAG: hypothetical protein KDK65_03985 [Chlamydiia bacterium]|nr:hypothetical protein [Chlamydiia bacterium]